MNCASNSRICRDSNASFDLYHFPKLIMCFYSLQQEELEIILPRKIQKLTATDFISGCLYEGADGNLGSSVHT